MNNDKLIKVVGMACTVAGFVLTVVQKQLDDRKLSDMIDKAVEEKLSSK